MQFNWYQIRSNTLVAKFLKNVKILPTITLTLILADEEV